MIIEKICNLSPVMPVIIIDNVEDAAPLAHALYDGGLKALEVTLRTPVALQAIHKMVKAVPDAFIGAGTILSAEDMVAAQKAGAHFGVSPGSTPQLLETALKYQFPFLPGVATPCEVMQAREMGYHILKFFPAEANGGVPTLKAWTSPLVDVSFCPTGGIGLENAKDYLALPNVICVGGSWVVPKELIQQKNWKQITQLAQEAALLRQGY